MHVIHYSYRNQSTCSKGKSDNGREAWKNMRVAQTWLIADTASSNIEEEIKLRANSLVLKREKTFWVFPKSEGRADRGPLLA